MQVLFNLRNNSFYNRMDLPNEILLKIGRIYEHSYSNQKKKEKQSVNLAKEVRIQSSSDFISSSKNERHFENSKKENENLSDIKSNLKNQDPRDSFRLNESFIFIKMKNRKLLKNKLYQACKHELNSRNARIRSKLEVLLQSRADFERVAHILRPPRIASDTVNVLNEFIEREGKRRTRDKFLSRVAVFESEDKIQLKKQRQIAPKLMPTVYFLEFQFRRWSLEKQSGLRK